MDPRLRWLLGISEERTRSVGYAMLALAVLAVVAVAFARPAAGVTFAVASGLAVAAVGYAWWNGGPLLAVLAASAGALLAVVAGIPGLFSVVALPAAFAAFAIAAVRAERAHPGPPPVGDTRASVALLILWATGVAAMTAVLATVPEQALGGRVWGDPAWVPWLRTLAMWGPTGLALGWAVARRGPVLVFALATAHLWPAYIAAWLTGPDRNTGVLYVGELFLSPPLEPLRGAAMLGLAVLAVVLAMAFEPAWPWLYERRGAGAPRQV